MATSAEKFAAFCGNNQPKTKSCLSQEFEDYVANVYAHSDGSRELANIRAGLNADGSISDENKKDVDSKTRSVSIWIIEMSVVLGLLSNSWLHDAELRDFFCYGGIGFGVFLFMLDAFEWKFFKLAGSLMVYYIALVLIFPDKAETIFMYSFPGAVLLPYLLLVCTVVPWMFFLSGTAVFVFNPAKQFTAWSLIKLIILSVLDIMFYLLAFSVAGIFGIVIMFLINGFLGCATAGWYKYVKSLMAECMPKRNS